MQSYSARKRSRSIAALIFLTLVGVGFFLFSLVAITCGFIINYHEDFKATDGGENLESKLEAEFDYSQYWLGLPVSTHGSYSLLIQYIPSSSNKNHSLKYTRGTCQ